MLINNSLGICKAPIFPIHIVIQCLPNIFQIKPLVYNRKIYLIIYITVIHPSLSFSLTSIAVLFCSCFTVLQSQCQLNNSTLQLNKSHIHKSSLYLATFVSNLFFPPYTFLSPWDHASSFQEKMAKYDATFSLSFSLLEFSSISLLIDAEISCMLSCSPSNGPSILKSLMPTLTPLISGFPLTFPLIIQNALALPI